MEHELHNSDMAIMAKLSRRPMRTAFVFGMDQIYLQFLVSFGYVEIHFDWSKWAAFATLSDAGKERFQRELKPPHRIA